MPDPTDPDFLAELIRLLDEQPGNHPDGFTIATNIGLAREHAEPTVQRLKARAHLDFAPAPRKMHHKWANRPLITTPAGYDIVEGRR
jgi:hypothetical protein